MRRISSKWTFFYKRVFPVIFFGFLAVFVGVSLFANSRSNSALDIPFLIVPIGIMVVVFLFRRN